MKSNRACLEITAKGYYLALRLTDNGSALFYLHEKNTAEILQIVSYIIHF